MPSFLFVPPSIGWIGLPLAFCFSSSTEEHIRESYLWKFRSMKSISSVSESLPEEEEEEEIWEQEDSPFSNNLKDLQNLRMQLYAAAEYFELSYANDDQKQIMIETLKDYAIKALVNTVDHLGSVAYKVNGFVDEKVDEASATELQVNSIEQTCQTHSDLQGLRQQSLVMNSPRYHKRYVLPAKCSHEFLIPWKAIPTKVKSLPSSLVSKVRLPSPSRQSHSIEGGLHKEPDKKRTISPCRFPLPRSGSLPSRPTTPTPNPSQPANPTLFQGRQQMPTEIWKSASVHVEEKLKEREQHQSKSKGLIRALLRKRKPKKNDEMLYTYLDKFS